MKKIIVILAFFLLGMSLFAQDRLAILPFSGGDDNEGDTIARFLGTELTRLGDFDIVPRTDAINKVMEEHNFQRNGLTDGDTIVALGKGANAKYVVSGHIQALGDRKMILVSILDVETFQQIAGDYYEYNDLSEVVEYLPILAEKLLDRTKNDYSNLQTLAILPFDGVDENNADVLAQLLAIELANSGKYGIVTRTTTIENVMKEQNIQRSGLTDGDTISKLGKAINADFVLSGAVSRVGNIDYMNVEIIDALSQVQKDGEYIEYKTIEDGIELMPQLSYDLTKRKDDEAKAAQVLRDQEAKEAQILKDNMLQDLKKGKWVGRGIWIGGATSLLGAGIIAVVSKSVEAPTRSDYSSFNDYEQAHRKFISEGHRDSNWFSTLAIVGGVAIIGGAITDIIFSGRENKLLKEFEAQGVLLSAIPVITPNLISNTMNYGVQVAVKLSF